MKYLAMILLLCSMAMAVDGKSLLIGISIGGGIAVSKRYTAIPVAKATAKVGKKVGHGTKHAAKVMVGR